MARIFISYSRVDKAFVDEFSATVRRLRPNEDIWHDQQIIGGSLWWDTILDNIARSDVFIYILSNESIESKYCQAEFAEAQRLQIPVLPILVNQRITLTDNLAVIQYVDMTRGVNDAESIITLNSALESLLSRSKRRQPLSNQRTSMPGISKDPTDTQDNDDSDSNQSSLFGRVRNLFGGRDRQQDVSATATQIEYTLFTLRHQNGGIEVYSLPYDFSNITAEATGYDWHGVDYQEHIVRVKNIFYLEDNQTNQTSKRYPASIYLEDKETKRGQYVDGKFRIPLEHNDMLVYQHGDYKARFAFHLPDRTFHIPDQWEDRPFESPIEESVSFYLRHAGGRMPFVFKLNSINYIEISKTSYLFYGVDACIRQSTDGYRLSSITVVLDYDGGHLTIANKDQWATLEHGDIIEYRYNDYVARFIFELPDQSAIFPEADFQWEENRPAPLYFLYHQSGRIPVYDDEIPLNDTLLEQTDYVRFVTYWAHLIQHGNQFYFEIAKFPTALYADRTGQFDIPNRESRRRQETDTTYQYELQPSDIIEYKSDDYVARFVFFPVGTLTLTLIEPDVWEENRPNVTQIELPTSTQSFTLTDEMLPRQFGEFTLGEKISEGGTAIIYRATTELGDEIVLKIARRVNSDAVETLLRDEDTILQTLNHPNIVAGNHILTTYSAPEIIINGETVTVPCVAMPYVEGKTLRQVMRDGDDYDREKVIQGVFSALRHAHDNNIIHGDLKPDNIMIQPDGEPVLIDWGIVPPLADLPESPELSRRGTPGYSAPELLEGDPFNKSVDVYSMGILLYEMLTGNHPSNGVDWGTMTLDEAGAIQEAFSQDPQKRPSSLGILLNRYSGLGFGYSHYPPFDFGKTSSDDPLPKDYRFLSAFGANSIDDLNIADNWEQNNLVENAHPLQVLIGIDENQNLVNLSFDQNETGVHYAVAGSTGSGKSEFVTTLVSATVSLYSPETVTFSFVRMRGNFDPYQEFADLPHTRDTFNSSEEVEILQHLGQIREELDRRGKMLIDYTVKDILEYRQRGNHLTAEPMPYQIIIFDCAELVTLPAGIVTQLETISRLGRALGIYLVLVSRGMWILTDQLRANMKTKIHFANHDDGATFYDEGIGQLIYQASDLSRKIPGRALMKIGDADPILMQVLYSGFLYSDRTKTNYNLSNLIPLFYQALFERVRDLAPVLTQPVSSTRDQLTYYGNLLKDVVDNSSASNAVNMTLRDHQGQEIGTFSPDEAIQMIAGSYLVDIWEQHVSDLNDRIAESVVDGGNREELDADIRWLIDYFTDLEDDLPEDIYDDFEFDVGNLRLALSEDGFDLDALDDDLLDDEDITSEDDPQPSVPQLRVIDSTVFELGESFALDTAVIAVGRGEGQDIRIDHPSLSRQHLTIYNEDGVLSIVDENSLYGTQLNGMRILPNIRTDINNRDEIQLADVVTFRVEIPDTEQTTTADTIVTQLQAELDDIYQWTQSLTSAGRERDVVMEQFERAVEVVTKATNDHPDELGINELVEQAEQYREWFFMQTYLFEGMVSEGLYLPVFQYLDNLPDEFPIIFTDGNTIKHEITKTSNARIIITDLFANHISIQLNTDADPNDLLAQVDALGDYLSAATLIRLRALIQPIRPLLTMEGHTATVNGVAVSGELAISASSDTTLKVWNWQTGEQIRTLEGHTAAVIGVAVSDEFVVSTSNDNTLKVWNWRTGEQIRTLEGHTATVQNVALSGEYAISASRDTTLRIWNWQTGEQIRTLEGHTDTVYDVALSGDFAVSASRDNTLKVWNWQTGEQIRTLEGHTSDIFTVALSDTYAVSGDREGILRVWDWQTGEQIRTLEGQNLITSVALSGDFAVSTSGDNTISVWNWQTGEQLNILDGHTSSVQNVALSGDFAISTSADNTLKVWNWRGTDTTLDDLISVETTPEVKIIAPLLTMEGHTDIAYSVALSGNFAISASKDNTISVWDWQTGELIRSLEGHTGTVRSVALAGNFAISTSDDTTMRVWNWQSGELTRRLEGHTEIVYEVVLSNEFAITSSEDRTIKVWNWQTGDLIRTLEGHTESVYGVALTGDRVISASADNTLKVWNWQTGELVRTLEGHRDAIRSVAISGDFAVSASYDTSVGVWNWRTGELIRQLDGHMSIVFGIAILDEFAVSASYDMTIKVWNWQTGELIRSLDGHTSSVRDIALSSDFVVSASDDNTLKVWNWRGTDVKLENLVSENIVPEVVSNVVNQINVILQQASDLAFEESPHNQVLDVYNSAIIFVNQIIESYPAELGELNQKVVQYNEWFKVQPRVMRFVDKDGISVAPSLEDFEEIFSYLNELPDSFPVYTYHTDNVLAGVMSPQDSLAYISNLLTEFVTQEIEDHQSIEPSADIIEVWENLSVLQQQVIELQDVLPTDLTLKLIRQIQEAIDKSETDNNLFDNTLFSEPEYNTVEIDDAVAQRMAEYLDEFGIDPGTVLVDEDGNPLEFEIPTTPEDPAPPIEPEGDESLLTVYVHIGVDTRGWDVGDMHKITVRFSPEKENADAKTLLLTAESRQFVATIQTSHITLTGDTSFTVNPTETTTMTFEAYGRRPGKGKIWMLIDGNVLSDVGVLRSKVDVRLPETYRQSDDDKTDVFELPDPSDSVGLPVFKPDIILRLYTFWLDENREVARIYGVASSSTYDHIPAQRKLGFRDVPRILLDELVADFANIVRADPAPTLAHSKLIQYGRRLWDTVMPPRLTRYYRNFIRPLRGDTRHSILLLVDDDPWLPFELAIPFVVDSADETPYVDSADNPLPLCELFDITRYVEGYSQARRTSFALPENVFVTRDRLLHGFDVGDEHAITWQYGEMLPPEAQLKDGLARRDVQGFHFISAPKGLQTYQITPSTASSDKDWVKHVRDQKKRLTEISPLTTQSVRRVQGRTLSNPAEALSLMENGASAFVGTWWAVDPADDRIFWQTFYNALQKSITDDRSMTFGKAVFVARQMVKRHSRNPMSWLAYYAMGDPMAKAYKLQPAQGYLRHTWESAETGNITLETGKPYNLLIELFDDTPPMDYNGKRYKVATWDKDIPRLDVRLTDNDNTILDPLEKPISADAIASWRVSVTFDKPGPKALILKCLDASDTHVLKPKSEVFDVGGQAIKPRITTPIPTLEDAVNAPIIIDFTEFPKQYRRDGNVIELENKSIQRDLNIKRLQLDEYIEELMDQMFNASDHQPKSVEIALHMKAFITNMMKVNWWLEHHPDAPLVILNPPLEIALELAQLNGGLRVWGMEFTTGYVASSHMHWKLDPAEIYAPIALVDSYCANQQGSLHTAMLPDASTQLQRARGINPIKHLKICMRRENSNFLHLGGHCLHDDEGNLMLRIQTSYKQIDILDPEVKPLEASTKFEENPIIVMTPTWESGSVPLVDMTKFALQFVQLGAGAVVTSFYALPDDLHNHFIDIFYGHLRDDSPLSLGQALRETRRQLYEQDKNPLALSYILFGNPEQKVNLQ